MASKTRNKFSPDVRARAVRMVADDVPPNLALAELKTSGFKARLGGGAEKPFMSEIGTLLRSWRSMSS